MKKIIIIGIVTILYSCSSSHPGRVCGGPGGRRCVENKVKSESKPTIVLKRNS